MRAAAATSTPAKSHPAFLRIQMHPIAVLRRNLRVELGWRSSAEHMHALKSCIRQASTELEWDTLLGEAKLAC